nr:hypothetical protein [Desulfospira joergensenii]
MNKWGEHLKNIDTVKPLSFSGWGDWDEGGVEKKALLENILRILNGSKMSLLMKSILHGQPLEFLNWQLKELS